MAVPGWPLSACWTASIASARTVLMQSWSRAVSVAVTTSVTRVLRSQQAGLGRLPELQQPIEPVHQQVHLLRAGARLERDLQLFADLGHLLTTLLGALRDDLVEHGRDLGALRFIARD